MLRQFLIFVIIFLGVEANAKENDVKKHVDSQEKKIITKRVRNNNYGYLEREHTNWEMFKDVSFVYGVSWILYPATQPSSFKNNGSWDRYKKNFGKIKFDQDAPFWNFFVHPISGGQIYLYFRANSYGRIQSVAMAFITAALFEFTVEIWQEPASIQDLYQTPVMGAILGWGIENLSMYLLNTGHPIGKFFGHLINPSTLFWFYEGKINIAPTIDKNGRPLVGFYMDF